MSPLVESIKIKNGKPIHIDYHQKRLDIGLKEYFKLDSFIDLKSALSKKLQEAEIEKIVKEHNICKCRVLYRQEIEKIEITPYIRKQVESLKLVYDDSIDYTFKYDDRSALNNLLAKKEDCDDILIVKNNCITDTSYSSILFYDGRTWYTSDTFLLNSTKRAFLLDNSIVKLAHITVDDLAKYTKARIVNAMIDFEDEVDIDIEKIVF